MILFHLNITSMFPLAVPLEWNLFMIFGILFLFGHYGDMPLSTIGDPLLIAVLAVPCLLLPLIGGNRPDKISFLPSMRYYAGNWATTPGSSARAAGRRRSSTAASRSRRGSSSSRSARSTTRRRPSSCSTRGSPSGRCIRTGGR